MADTESVRTGRGPSFSLLITGLLGLAVSVWALLGSPTLPALGIPLGWVLVLGAGITGILLVLSPRKRRRS
ncbi:hypothetical protein ACFYTF_07450 [Nocardia thailandica]|uniref:DUF2530 domain-containing protein n=1 Tax=Nocardia thailandica TaxID=257275 RepID=A0ABW6PJX1_9NOCA